MYTKNRDSAGTDEKVTNSANWRIKRWRIRRVLLYFAAVGVRKLAMLEWEWSGTNPCSCGSKIFRAESTSPSEKKGESTFIMSVAGEYNISFVRWKIIADTKFRIIVCSKHFFIIMQSVHLSNFFQIISNFTTMCRHNKKLYVLVSWFYFFRYRNGTDFNVKQPVFGVTVCSNKIARRASAREFHIKKNGKCSTDWETLQTARLFG